MSRICPACGGLLGWASGYEEAGRDRGGNGVEVDELVCGGCRRRYRHVVRERFSGNDHSWSVRGDDGSWEALPEERWPRSGGS